MKILVGSTKGLLIFDSQGQEFVLSDVHFKGLPVSTIIDGGDGRRFWVALSMKHWGPKLFMTSNGGLDWKEVSVPLYPEDVNVREGRRAILKLIWSGLYQPSSDLLWLGTEPGGLFVSKDQGKSFSLVKSLWNHPSREEHWFGGGRDEAGIHTILQHPHNPNQLIVGVSCGGVFISMDAGLNWRMCNVGLRADYLPDPTGPYGHDPHMIRICQTDPNTMWQQNHCGVFVSRNGGASWLDVTAPDAYGRYGFPIVIDDSNPEKAWIIPAESDEQRVAKDQRLVVCCTEDGGDTWQKFTEGLPQKDCFDLVFRHAFTRVPDLMAFGTTTGNLFLSSDQGVSWEHVSAFLPAIHSVLIIEH